MLAYGSFEEALRRLHLLKNWSVFTGEFLCKTDYSELWCYETTYTYCRVKHDEMEGVDIAVDVLYLYRKYKSLIEAGEQVSLPALPSVPLTGWKAITEDTYTRICCLFHSSCNFRYGLALCTCFKNAVIILAIINRASLYLLIWSCLTYWRQGAFRVLAQGYTHLASGRLQGTEVNTNHLQYYHVCCTMKPLMRPAGSYCVYLLLG